MKFFFIVFGILFNAVVANAQIVLDAQNFVWDTQNLTSLYYYKQSSAISIPTEGENQIWDYSSLTSLSTAPRNYIPSNVANLPLSEYYYDFTNAVSSITYTKARHLFIDAAGWRVEGLITYSSYADISAMTGNAGDNIKFPADTFLYTTPGYIIKFPTQYNTSTVDTMITETRFLLTIQAFGFNETPCVQKQYMITDDQFSGYGSLKAPSSNNPNYPCDVVQVKRNTTTIDSIFVNGMPADPALLSAFGLTQGQTTRLYDYYFYRPQTHNYMFRIACNNNFSSVNTALWDSELPFNSSIQNNKIPVSITIFPNPTNGIMTIETGDYEVKNIELSDMSGKIIIHCNISESSRSYVIGLTEFQNGIYFLKVETEAGIFVEKIIKN